jgi:hypothetical protein
VTPKSPVIPSGSEGSSKYFGKVSEKMANKISENEKVLHIFKKF